MIIPLNEMIHHSYQNASHKGVDMNEIIDKFFRVQQKKVGVTQSL